MTFYKVGGRTLLKDPNYESTLRIAANDPSTMFSVTTDGMSGESTYAPIMGAASRGAGGATDMEMSILYQAGRLPGVNFLHEGLSIANPF